MTKVHKQNYKLPEFYTEAGFENFQEFFGVPIELPEPIRVDVPKPIIKLSFPDPDDFFQVMDLDIVSSKYRTEIEKFTSKEIQYFQIKLLNPDGSRYEEQQYYMAHLGFEIDCFDYEKSDYDQADDGYIKRIRKPVLREEAIGDAHIFWVANTSSLPFWMVSDEFAAHMEATDLTGMLFLNLDEVKML